MTAHVIFQSASQGTYAELHKGIMKDPDNLIVAGHEIGFEKVRSEKHAHIGDETALLMNTVNDCQISLIDERFYKTGFGLAFPEDWPYKKYFDEA